MDATAETPESRPPGRVLAAERERQGLSRAEIAQRLHMSASQIEALEGDDYSRLPPGPFLRGFVRNYAKLLGLDAGALLSELAEAAPRSRAPDIVVPSQNIRFDPMGERLASPYVKATLIAVVFLALGFAAMYWWLFIRPAAPVVVRAPAVEQKGPPQQIATAPMPPPEASPPAPAPTEPATPPGTEPVSAAPPAPAAPAPARAPEKGSVPGERVIRLTFRGESWVEIRDASGNVLLSKLNAPGSVAEVRGQPPLRVVVGNAPEVQMTYEGRAFPLEPHTNVAVARFTLE